ncbi:MAG: hypothetical protein M4D80_22885 [Myxococcota bacterium]|nr:hypothetical protein [Myxococcota bacterium]
MKKKTAKKSAKSKAKPAKKKSPVAPKKSKSKPAAKAKPKPKAQAKTKKKSAAPKKAKASKKSKASNWTKFVEQHGVVLASAKGPVPSVAEAIVGETIVGSWWSHPKGQQIFDALSTIDDSDDIRCFKLVDHKITFVHRRLWPALAKLAQAGVLDADRVTSIQQEHMPTGEHRNITMPFPDWVPDDTMANADSLSVDEAKTQLGTWVA